MFRLFGIFESHGIDQTHILDQLSKYLEVSHEIEVNAEQSEQEKPRRENFISKIKNSRGHCSGFSLLFLYGIWLQDHPVPGDEKIEKDDLNWFMRVLGELSNWDGKARSLNKSKMQDFDRLLNHLEYFQNITDYQPELNLGDLDTYVEDTKNRNMACEYVLGGLFTYRDLASKILPDIIQSERMMLVTSHDHAIGLYMKDGIVHVYDSNNKNGELKFNMTEENRPGCIPCLPGKNPLERIANEIFKSFSFNTGSGKYPIQFRNFTMQGALDKELPLATYQSKEDLLATLEIIEKKQINFQSTAADSHTALSVAAGVGDSDSVRFYLLKGADYRVSFNDYGNEKSVLELAALRGYGETVEVLLNHILSKADDAYETKEMSKSIAAAMNKKSSKCMLLFIEKFLKVDKIKNHDRYIDAMYLLIGTARVLNREDLMLKLLEKGKENHQFNKNRFQNDILDFVIRFGSINIVNVLLSTIPTIFKIDEQKELFIYAYRAACASDRPDIAEIIQKSAVKSGISQVQLLSEVDENGRNPFQHALLSDKGDTVMNALLTSITAKELNELRDGLGNNVLHLTAGKNGSKKFKLMCEKILEQPEGWARLKELISAKNNEGSTPLKKAITSGGKDEIAAVYDLCKAIASHAFDADSKDEINNVPRFVEDSFTVKDTNDDNILQLAANRGSTEMMTALLNVVDQHPEMYDKLLDNRNAFGNNCLHLILRKTDINIEILKSVLSRMSDEKMIMVLNAKNDSDQTPLEVAQAKIRDTKMPCTRENKAAIDYLNQMLAAAAKSRVDKNETMRMRK